MAGDDSREHAFERLFAAHYWDVRRYVLRRSPAADVEDVLADTFLVAWRRLDSLGEDPLPCLFGVARRVLANHLRARDRRGALAARLISRFGPTDIGWEPPAEMSERLAVAMASLSHNEREALLLVAWEGLDPVRAARAAGCSGPAFRVRLHRARRRVAGQIVVASGPGERSSLPEEVQ